MELETIKVTLIDGTEAVINADDFDAKIHTKAGDKPPVKRRRRTTSNIKPTNPE